MRKAKQSKTKSSVNWICIRSHKDDFMTKKLPEYLVQMNDMAQQ